MSSKRSTTAARWSRYMLAGALLAVLVASGISAQLFATSETPHGSSMEDAHRTLYAHGDRLRPLVEETGGAQALNIYGPGGQIIAQATRDDQSSEAVRYPLADHLGSTRVALDADGNVVARFEYGPHGETAAASGVAAPELRYRYTGHPWDAAQGVYETPARTYDPTTGRFLSVDPQRQDASPYVYAGNNPVGFLDPTGGGGVPYIMRSGFWDSTDLRHVAGLDESSVLNHLDYLSALSTALGRAKGQRTKDAADVFGSDPSSRPAALYDTAGFLGAYSKREYQYGERLYWFIGNDKDIMVPTHFRESVDAIRAHPLGNKMFARDIVLVDFTESGSPSVGSAADFLRSQGFRYSRIKASQHGPTYARVDDVVYKLKSDHEALRTHVDDSLLRTHVDDNRRVFESTIADHPWIVGETSETRSLPRDQLTPLGDPPHGVPLPQHELTPLGDPPYRIPLPLPPEPMDTSD